LCSDLSIHRYYKLPHRLSNQPFLSVITRKLTHVEVHPQDYCVVEQFFIYNIDTQSFCVFRETKNDFPFEVKTSNHLNQMTEACNHKPVGT
jgi:hypothetical protein